MSRVSGQSQRGNYGAINVRLLVDLVKERTQSSKVTRIELAAPLKAGMSGSRVWLTHIYEKERFRFGVLKIPGEGKRRDVEMDREGYNRMREHWPSEFLPRESHDLFSHPELVAGRPEAPVLLIGFADERSSITPEPLSDLLDHDHVQAGNCLDKLLEVYADRTTQACRRDFARGEACFVRTASGPDIAAEMLHPDLVKKIREFDWTAFGLDVNSRGHIVNLTVRPNPVFALNNRGIWKSDPVICPFIPIHGDLNLDNVIWLRDARSFVLIDFEKSRPGPPQFDPAFLFMWMIKKVRLNQVGAFVGEEEAALSRLAETLAAALGGNEPEIPVKVGHKDHYIVSLAQILLSRLRAMVDTDLVPSEFQIKTLRLALSMAALARSFYELRASLGTGGSQSELHKLFGYFYYDLSACMIDDDELIPRAALRPPRPSTPKAEGAASPVKHVPELTFSSGTSVQPAFYTKLVFTIGLKSAPHDWSIPGWNRIADSENSFGYFSRLSIAANDEFRGATQEVFVWAPDERGRELPVVLALDLNVLRNRRRLTSSKLSIPVLELDRIDLIPLKNGSKAELGLRFVGGECLLPDYLAWVSSRTFSKYRLSRLRGPAEDGPSIGGLVAELESAFNERRLPLADEMKTAASLDEARICQYALMGPHEPDWLNVVNGPDFETGWELARTLSRTRANYPKYSRKDGIGCWKWDHNQAPGTRYGISEKAITVWAHAADDFNRETKPMVVTSANYAQWLLAKDLTTMNVESTEIRRIASFYTEDVRRMFFEQCAKFFAA